MKSIDLNRRILRNDLCPKQKVVPARAFDTQTTQAFYQLRLHTEDLALELAVRLRVLGKSLAAACPKAGAEKAGSAGTYTHLRRQFDCFLRDADDRGITGHPSFAVVQDYLQGALPCELNGCVKKDFCRIGLIEAAISLLSGNSGDNEEFASERRTLASIEYAAESL